MTILAGQDLTAALLNGAISGPLAQLRQTVAQTLTNATFTAITFDSEDIDTDNGHSNVTNNSRYTVPATGYYRLDGGVSFVPNTAGGRAARWAINGTGINGSGLQCPANASGLISGMAARSMVMLLVAGDFIQLQAWQSSGGNLDTGVVADQQATMTISWVRG